MREVIRKLKLPLVLPLIVLLGLGWWAQKNPQLHFEQESGQIKNVGPAEAKGLLADEKVLAIDVHIPEQEHLAGTEEFIPFNEIKKQQERLPEDKGTPILVYCRSGSMSQEASSKLIEIGYKDVYNLKGGVRAYRGAVRN